MAAYKGLVFEWKQHHNSFDEYVLGHLERFWNIRKSNTGGSIDSNSVGGGLDNALRRWWDDVKQSKPFASFIAERIDKYTIKLKKTQEKSPIAQLFHDANISIENAPPIFKHRLPEWIASKKDTTFFEIKGNQYQILGPLANVDKENSNGWLYKAKDKLTNEVRVIKILHSQEDKEGKIYERMPPHPNIVAWYGTEILYGFTWIVIEFIDGKRVTQKSFDEYPELSTQLNSVRQFLSSQKIIWEEANSNMMYTTKTSPV